MLGPGGGFSRWRGDAAENRGRAAFEWRCDACRTGRQNPHTAARCAAIASTVTTDPTWRGTHQEPTAAARLPCLPILRNPDALR